MKKLIYFIFISVLLLGCSTKPEHEVKRIRNVTYSTVTDSIYSSMPGKILTLNGCIYWQDALGVDSFMHVVDASSGKELFSFGHIGDGPDEFIMPLPSVSADGFYLSDFQKGIEHFYVVTKENGWQVESRTAEKSSSITQVVHVEKDKVVCLTPDGNQLFQLYCGEDVSDNGKFPLDKKYSNAFYYNQGNIAYNPVRKTLVYSGLFLPYLATYNFKDCQLSLQKERFEEIDYTVHEGELVLGENSKRGAMELALTKKYIVTLDRDNKVEGVKPKGAYARDPSTLPHSLFIYDYELNLIQIVNMQIPLLRICGDVEEDVIYAMTLSPEYELIRIDLAAF